MNADRGEAGLPFQDHVNLARLKRLAVRSLHNRGWLRDADYVLKYVEHGIAGTADEKWPDCSVLRAELDAVVKQLKDFRGYVRDNPSARRAGTDVPGDAKWQAVLDAIDHLLAEAERRLGHRLRVND